MPQFATPMVMTIDWDGNTEEYGPENYTCYVVDQRTEYIVWAKDAFRSCIAASLE